MKTPSRGPRATLSERRVRLSPVEALAVRVLQSRGGGIFAELVVEVRAFDGTMGRTDHFDLPIRTLPDVAAALLEVQREAYGPTRSADPDALQHEGEQR